MSKRQVVGWLLANAEKKPQPEHMWDSPLAAWFGPCMMSHLSLTSNGGKLQMRYGGRIVSACRFVWEQTRKRKLGKLHCRHRCDRPACINPRHLVSGTNADNVRDKMRRGRHKSGGSKLSEFQVRRIRQLYTDGGYTQKDLAEMFGVSATHVCYVVNREAWRHIA